jgi:hypothetical protein
MFVRVVGLTWRRREDISLERWVGVDDDGRVIGHVSDMVTHERGRPVSTYSARWMDRRRAPGLVDLGYSFDSAESAMSAVDQSWAGSC